jgi:hypothetical protein
MATIFGACCLCVLSVALLKVLTIWLASVEVVWLLLQEEEKPGDHLAAHRVSCAGCLFLLLLEVGVSLNFVKNADPLNVWNVSD